MIELPIEHIEAGYVYVAEQASVILGFSVVLPQSDGNAELDGLFVEPTFWHQGIGKQLVQIALNDLHIYPIDFKMHRGGKGANPREHR
ncbi:hypothetical protein CKY01_04205 [Photorhabdus laumondii subsp. clarkei]|uniref:N-acetyltransferase domain-containing protein n=2 Tax=Photorhabdus TaxID=29487 RepID=A0A329VLL6_9GAMM|nr:hypothetical protein CKY01_04205 [Photorhabdus laumondii subsp. clarkei]